VAPHGYSGAEGRISRIGVGFDGSPESRLAVAVGAALAERTGGTLTALAVVPPASPDIGGALLGTFSAAQLEKSVEERMREALEEAAGEVSADVGIERRLLHGDPGSELASAAEGLDLLILGSRCYGPLRSALMGGVSAKLMHSSPAPVLVIPRGAGPDPLLLSD
jgi:nucleotide-binding universal stress UspA family protein